ncbi:MAG TPA: SH3 domain-containing protein [Myxococcales bacterium]|nr:SH3 domain-containing protein [Myxococcales bacterium]
MPGLLLALSLLASPADLRQAEQAYLARNFPAAEKAYGAALAAGNESADLEYDMGTAAAQAGDIGQAVLHLERALVLSPWDGDARDNLDRVRDKRVDKVVGQDLGESPLQRLLRGLPAAELSWTFAALWILGFLLLVLRRRRSWFRPLGLACAVFGLGLGGLSWACERADGIPFGVVLAKVTPVRAGPDPKLPASFEVHEGLKVLLEERDAGYQRIRLANGLEGWVEAGGVEKI